MRKSLRSCVMLVMLASLLAVLLAAPAWASGVKPEIPYEDGVPLIPGIEPVIVVQGSDYDMGYQYAQQLNQVFGPWALQKLQRSLTKAEVAALRADQWYIKKCAPEWIPQLRGFSAGATAAGVRLSYAEALASYYSQGRGPGTTGPVATYPGTEPPQSKKEQLRCSGWAAWGSTTKDGTLIAAGSSDAPIVGQYTVVALPKTGNSYILGACLPYGTGTIHPAMNNKGLAFVHHGAGVSGNEAPGYGIPQNLAVPHTLRFTNNAADALEMQLSYPRGIRPNGLWADTSGGAFDIECRDPLVIRRAGAAPAGHGEDDFIYSTNNVLATQTDAGEAIQPYLAGGAGHGMGWPLNYFGHGGWNLDDMNTVRRNLFMWNMLHNYQGSVDLEFAKMMWRIAGPAPDYPTLEEAEQDLNATHGGNGKWDTYIGNLGNQHIGIVQPDNGNKGKYLVCIGPPGRGAEPLTQQYYFFGIANPYTFYQLQLAATAPEVVAAAKTRSQYDLYDANKQLRKLTYHDVAYASLDAIFNKAATESQKGDWYLGLAAAAKGNQQVCAYGKALRAFTRCQAYAKQVYEALVPPADDPTDLPGLADMPWFGDWAEEGAWLTAPSGDDASGNP